MAVVQGSHQKPTFPKIACNTRLFEKHDVSKFVGYYRKILKKWLQRLDELINPTSELLALTNIFPPAQDSN